MSVAMRQKLCAVLALLVLPMAAPIAAEAPAGEAEDSLPADMPAELRERIEAMRSLDWVTGPTTVDVAGNSKLFVPEGYAFLDAANTTRYLELNHNLGDGTEVMITPESQDWEAYLSFAAEGYVKDDEKIDAGELLEALQEGAEAGNEERARRGWSALRVVGWAVPPAYNPTNQRLEWGTLLESENGRSANFSTKVLSRRGHTSVILVSAPEDLAAARPQLDEVLGGYSFVEGERYSDFMPGDKVATYGLAALVLGGAAAVASKKGLWAVIGAFIISKIKLLIGAVVALGALLRKFIFGKKASDAG